MASLWLFSDVSFVAEGHLPIVLHPSGEVVHLVLLELELEEEVLDDDSSFQGQLLIRGDSHWNPFSLYALNERSGSSPWWGRTSCSTPRGAYYRISKQSFVPFYVLEPGLWLDGAH